jgi:tRNA(Ile)-lysidine synthase
VRQLCERLGVPFELLQFERRLPREQGVSREEQLRDERYRYLAQAVGRLQLEGVVTAHTLDDQAETILMRLISGSGPLGSAGMHTLTSLATTAGTIRIVRPLLDVSRADLEHVLAVAGVSAKEDPSNDSLEYRRNALRHQVMPALRAIEPGFAGALVRSTRLAHDDAVECDLLADQRFEELVQVQSNTRAITRDFVESGSPALLRRIIRRMIFEVLVDDRDVAREVTLERVEAVRLAASKRTGAVIELPGGAVAVIERELVRIMRSGEANDGGGHAAGGA